MTSEGENAINPAGEVDRALDIAGYGWYSFKVCIILYSALFAALLELIGSSMVLPAAKCDLNMSDKQRGFVTSIPYIGIFSTSYIHGYLADTHGRKKILIYSTLLTGCFSMLSGLMPEIISYSICKLFTALCITGPSAIPYAYIAEVVSLRHRDVSLAMGNAFQITSTSVITLIAWGVLPLNVRVDFGLYMFRSWRLLTVVYALVILLITYMLTFIPPSPKFLLSKGKPDEALKVLLTIYATNTRKALDTFPIKSLSMPPKAIERSHLNLADSLKSHTAPILKWEYFKYLLLNGMLLFGIFSILNGLYVWVPDLLNRVFSGANIENKKACEIIMDKFEKEKETTCNDTFHPTAFKVNALAQFICGMVSIPLALSVKYFNKKILLYITYFVMGTMCITINHIRQAAVFVIFISSFPLMALQIGTVNAYSVQIFPTYVRGMAICLSMMLGRLGGISGNLITGALITAACEVMFYIFGSVLLFCGLLSFLHK